MTRKEFNEMYVGNKVAVHCPTKDLSDEFLELAEDFDYRWSCGHSYSSLDCWDSEKENTAYCINSGLYCNMEYYKQNGYEIRKFISVK